MLFLADIQTNMRMPMGLKIFDDLMAWAILSNKGRSLK